MSPKHIELLQILRDVAGPLKVTSGIRCPAHNAEVGGAKRSKHLPNKDGFCAASDITYATGTLSNRRILKLYVLADQIVGGRGFKGIGLYKGRIHVDSREGRRARWVDHFWNWKDS